MSKRHHRSTYISPLVVINPVSQSYLDRQKAEKMCQKKLKKISNDKSKLCQTVLIRNTLTYVQNSYCVTFSMHDEDEPLNKKRHRDDTIADDIDDDIDDILSEMIFLMNLFHLLKS